MSLLKMRAVKPHYGIGGHCEAVRSGHPVNYGPEVGEEIGDGEMVARIAAWARRLTESPKGMTINLRSMILVALTSAFAFGQPAVVASPKFEVAALKLCKGDGPGASKGGSPLGGGGPTSAGALHFNCATVSGLIQEAYVTYANASRDLWSRVPIDVAPAWINSDRYDINAKAEDSPSPGTMQGPMLRALLEDRFKLRIHRETREVPIYVLTVVKSGSKLQQFKEGSCIPIDLTKPPSPTTPGQTRGCTSMISGSAKGPNMASMFMQATTVDEFSKALGFVLARPVINKSGIAGLFDFRMEYAIDETISGTRVAPSDEPAVPSIFTAIQEQLGLKLDSAKGPGERLVIDHVEKPSEN